ncbi:hypothetical protein TREES_T100008764 [Tupaia chinensis]|uniref:Uncharacterized protein n=1 Tax=Tupaia chinensis TaxID=246437 RepID=L9L1F3_TUPCH|nr:hypothetical protein TREES_T100008764 [Tupaia chinensis]
MKLPLAAVRSWPGDSAALGLRVPICGTALTSPRPCLRHVLGLLVGLGVSKRHKGLLGMQLLSRVAGENTGMS